MIIKRESTVVLVGKPGIERLPSTMPSSLSQNLFIVFPEIYMPTLRTVGARERRQLLLSLLGEIKAGS
jgi:hypothetical protein